MGVICVVFHVSGFLVPKFARRGGPGPARTPRRLLEKSASKIVGGLLRWLCCDRAR